MKKFEEIDDSLPRKIKRLYVKFKDEEELTDELISKEAKAHKSCISLYKNQKLTRKRKSYEENKENSECRDTEDKQHEPDIAVRSVRKNYVNMADARTHS